MNQFKTSNHHCATAHKPITVTRQTFRIDLGIGSDQVFTQHDYECSNGSNCTHRTGENCGVFRLNNS
jgi:hypothetical protein